ncbi:hypothetical protein SPHV1_2400011 [Novosphingobium sp. KN65.2]|nr:hypothetical protein SPHV1_2400011 [Novosphingobium sp. KN65.2]
MHLDLVILVGSFPSDISLITDTPGIYQNLPIVALTFHIEMLEAKDIPGIGHFVPPSPHNPAKR